MTANQCVTCIFNESQNKGFYSDGSCGGCECALIHKDTRVANHDDLWESDCPAYEVNENVLNRCHCGGHPAISMVPAGLWKVRCCSCVSTFMCPTIESAIECWNMNEGRFLKATKAYFEFFMSGTTTIDEQREFLYRLSKDGKYGIGSESDICYYLDGRVEANDILSEDMPELLRMVNEAGYEIGDIDVFQGNYSTPNWEDCRKKLDELDGDYVAMWNWFVRYVMNGEGDAVE